MKIGKLKEKLYGNVFYETDLDNILGKENFIQIESDSQSVDDVIKYSNYKWQIWVYVNRDEEGMLLVTDVKRVTKISGISTCVEPFHNFDDLNKVLSYFWEKEMYHHWLCGGLMAALGRRISDTISLKWSDLFLSNGQFRERMDELKEQKTGKNVRVRINEFAKDCVKKYCNTLEITPLEHYQERIFSCGASAFRLALSKAVDYVGISYPVSTHSFRKFYGNVIYKLHPNDVDRLTNIQFMFGHSDATITKGYIGAIDEAIDRYNEDYSQYLMDASQGKEIAFQSDPVLTVKTEDLREVIAIAYKLGKENNNSDGMEVMNNLLNLIESKRVS